LGSAQGRNCTSTPKSRGKLRAKLGAIFDAQPSRHRKDQESSVWDEIAGAVRARTDTVEKEIEKPSLPRRDLELGKRKRGT